MKLMFHRKMQVNGIFKPNAATYARNAIATLGKINSSTGYWAHSIQEVCIKAPPEWIIAKMSFLTTSILRRDYLKQKEK